MLQPYPICGEDNLLRMDVNVEKDNRQASVTCCECGFTINGMEMPDEYHSPEAKISALLSWNLTALHKQKNKEVNQMKEYTKDVLKPKPHEIIDFALKGNVIRFFLGTNGKQWGDDWNDAPYEHNAGEVYDEYVSGISDCYVPFDCYVFEPANGCYNTPFCKEDMIKGKVPCVIIVPVSIAKTSWNDYSFDYWLGNKDVIKIYFGDNIDEVQTKINDLYIDADKGVDSE